MKEQILKMILDKIKFCEKKDKLIVDRIDVVALKELHNDVMELNLCLSDIDTLMPTSKESDIEAEEMAPLFMDKKASKKRNFIVGWRHCSAYHRMFKGNKAIDQ